LNRLGPARLAAMGAVTLALVGFFAFVMMRMSEPAMGVLYADLSPQDAGAVLRDLEARNIPHETRAEGQTILAPRGELARIRMDLAGKGLPSGGGVGYEIFDKGDAFSSTSFVQGINHLRALEGELSRTIRSIGRVQAARVHLVIPERRLFDRDRESARASIVLKLRGELESGQVRAIRHLVASAVEGLAPERISIVDERGRLLADGAQGDAGPMGVGAEEKQTAMERRLRSQVEEIVAGVVGTGRSRVQVAAELEVNRVENRSETFDPESRVVRSTQSRAENQSSSSGDAAVSVGRELPGANPPAASPARDGSNKNEEVVNYEISRTTRTEVLEGGRLKRLSVAVLVDGVYARDANGEATYQPRSQDELDRIGALVRTAIGFDRSRGDQVEIVNLRFADAPVAVELGEEGLLASLFSPTREDALRLLEISVIALLTLIVLFAVVRPLLKRVVVDDRGAAPGAIAIADQTGAVAGTPELAAAQNGGTARLLEAAKMNSQVHAESIERIGEMVRTNPQETVAVLRNWLQER